MAKRTVTVWACIDGDDVMFYDGADPAPILEDGEWLPATVGSDLVWLDNIPIETARSLDLCLEPGKAHRVVIEVTTP
jgi:hypothetical protein